MSKSEISKRSTEDVIDHLFNEFDEIVQIHATRPVPEGRTVFFTVHTAFADGYEDPVTSFKPTDRIAIEQQGGDETLYQFMAYGTITGPKDELVPGTVVYQRDSDGVAVTLNEGAERLTTLLTDTE